MFTRDPQDRRRPERLTAGFLASLLFHALLAALLFSVATSSSQESSPESISGTTVVTVSREQPQRAVPAPSVAAPVPHTPVIAKRAAGRPRIAAARPYQRHELSKFAPTAPPNPTPVPANTLAPNPVPTQAVLAASPAPLEPAAPTSAPAQVVAVAPRVPPTPAPPKPTQAPTAAPTRAPQPQPTRAPKRVAATPLPKPSAAPATAAPAVALATPRPAATAGGTPQPNKVSNPAPSASPRPLSASPGPKPIASEGPRGQAPSKSVAPARPVQVVPTPRANPAPAAVPSRGKPTLNERLKSLIPTASPAPSVSRPPGKRYSFLNGLVPTPEPQPTPPPEVIATTKFIYEENVAKQRWKQSFLGTKPEERYVKMYVTSVKHLGFVTMCKGWVVRAPIAGNQHWIVEPDEEFICSGHLEPFTQPSPEPPKGS